MQQQVVRLLGDLGERHGSEHTFFNVRTPADAIKLLCINYPEFRNELATAHESGIGYRVLQAGVDLNPDELHLPIGQNDLIVTPVLAGAGSGAGRIFLGIALIGLSFVTFGGSALFAGGTGLGTSAGALVTTASATGIYAGAGSAAIGVIGASLVLGGVTQMLSPQPELPNGGVSTRNDFRATRPESVNRGSNGQQSYAYLGAQNTVGVGATIPVAYGKVLIGSHVISADVDVTDESDPIKKFTRTPGSRTMTVNGNKLRFGRRRDDSARWNNVSFQLNRSDSADRFTNIQRDNKVTTAKNFRLEFSGNPTQDPDKYFVFLEVNKLFEFVSGEGSTKTDAFITYKIESRQDGTTNIHASDTFTIQGLTMGRYRWYHKFDPNKASNIDFYKLDITIIDVSVDSSVELIVRHGFNPSIS
tara:strand:- start:3332 stop:4582 length:1251 start_codon:yes stop_codon:yes gene_type:complete